MECHKANAKNMHCEYSHQTGLMSACDVEWMMGDRLNCDSATAMCITRNPKQCAEGGCCKSSGWDKITTLYYSREKSEANTLIEQLAEKQWNTIPCLDGMADICSDGYFVCLLSQE